MICHSENEMKILFLVTTEEEILRQAQNDRHFCPLWLNWVALLK